MHVYLCVSRHMSMNMFLVAVSSSSQPSCGRSPRMEVFLAMDRDGNGMLTRTCQLPPLVSVA